MYVGHLLILYSFQSLFSALKTEQQAGLEPSSGLGRQAMSPHIRETGPQVL